MPPEITLPVAELKQALPGFSKLISRTRTLPVLQSVRVQRDNQGHVTIEGTNLDAHATYRLKDTQPGEAAEVVVPFDSLSKMAKGSSESLTLIPERTRSGCAITLAAARWSSASVVRSQRNGLWRRRSPHRPWRTVRSSARR